MEARLNPTEMQIALKFLMGKLDEGSLAELDAMLAGSNEEVAQDAALTKRREWIDLGARARMAVRKAKYSKLASDAASSKSFADRYPSATAIR